MKAAFFFPVLLIVSFNSFCQLSWCPAGATWHHNYTSISGNVGYVETKYVSDTVVAGRNCKKLVEHQRFRYYLGGDTTDIFKALFTYESGGVMYMFNLSQTANNWDTLYNFNTAVNSAWHLNATDTVSINVYAAGTKVIHNDTLQWRLVNFVSPCALDSGYDTLYERIGLAAAYRFGFVDPTYNYDPFEPSMHGLCNYRDDSFPLYGNADSACMQLPTGIPEIKESGNSISVFPNPVSERLTFKMLNNEQSTVVLYNVLSKEVIRQAFTGSTTINMAQLPGGIYFYEVSTARGMSMNGKVVKQ